jgi:hypothetical protein
VPKKFAMLEGNLVEPFPGFSFPAQLHIEVRFSPAEHRFNRFANLEEIGPVGNEEEPIPVEAVKREFLLQQFEENHGQLSFSVWR